MYAHALKMIGVVISSVALAGGTAIAQPKYDRGASDTEIRIGNTMPYSGPASAYAAVGKTEAAYFRMINDRGGVNGRKINFISYDDGYSPPKTVEQIRKLVESDDVLAIFSPLGTLTNSAVHKYLNTNKIPHLFVSSGATKWNDPKNFPWTLAFQPSYQDESRVYANYILKKNPNAKLAVLYQNDDLGKDYLKGLKDGLGDKASQIVAVASYETTEPTVDSHIVKLRASGADVFVNIATPKFAAQAIRKLGQIGWQPLQLVMNVGASVGAVLQPAGFENAQGLLSAAYAKDGSDPQWASHADMSKVYSFLDKYYPDADRTDSFVIVGYGMAQAMVKLLEMCGDDLTRENVMRQAANMKGVQLDTLLPGITMNTSPDNFGPINQLQMMEFKGQRWHLIGDVMSAH